MQCAVCKANVGDFRLKSFNAKEAAPRPVKTDILESLLPSAFDVNPFFVPPTNATIPRSSTPVEFAGPTVRGKDPVVLRIDNVPWVCCHWIDLSSVLTETAGYYSPHDRQLVEATCRPCSRLA